MKYYVLKCNVETKDLNETNYGVLMLNNDNSREYICNISDDAYKISSLVENMNDYNVDASQAKDIIEDFKFKNM